MQIDLETNKYNYGKKLIFLVSLIVIVGLLMVFSSSFIYSQEIYNNSYHFIFRQIIFLSLGLCVFFVVSKTKITFWIKYSEYLLAFVCLLIGLTFLPGIGVKVKGANRWINLYFFHFQPSELLKYVLILYSSKFFLSFHKFKNSLKHYLLFITPFVLLILQPDFGSFVICFIILVISAFLCDLDKKIFYSSLGIGILTLSFFLISRPYRVKRLVSYMNPWANRSHGGFQIIQSFLAFGGGGWLGKGLGNSQEKLFYLPEAHNDFIFSVLGEELGFIGVTIVLFLFFKFCYNGFKLAILINAKITKVILATIIFTIVIQVLLNVSVVMGLLPTKGLALPFISSGGSSMIANFFSLGIIFSCIRSEDNYSNLIHSESLNQSQYNNSIHNTSLDDNNFINNNTGNNISYENDQY